MFCDLVGSVTLTSQLDPEEWRATVADYQRVASEAVARFGGEVVRYVGDGIMAFFGYPIAHDNDAERAARAGLAILEGVAKLNESHPGRPNLSVRIGVDSGPVVIGAGAGQAIDAFGDTANIAARVQATAEPGTVVVTGATHRLISGLFVVGDRGTRSLRGMEQPAQLFRVVRPSGLRGRFEAAAAAGGLTPFVGRQDELRSLLTRWERAREGEGQVVTIIGEAGIGKSRFVRRFHEQITDTRHTWLEAGAGAFFQSTPFYPVAEMLRQFVVDIAPGTQVTALAPRLTGAGLDPGEAIPLLAPMLNLPLPPGFPASTLPPEQQRRRLLATLVQWVLGSAHTQPLISVIEDLHWADPSTLELIQLLVEQGATAPLMLLYTARPEFRPPWPLRAHHLQLTLNRLSSRDVRTMVGEVAARKALPNETVATVVERTGGVPLFVEELTRAILESGDAKLTGSAIPVTLRDSLMARLDRLGPAKEVAQVGAVIGNEFSYELIHSVSSLPDGDLQGALRNLAGAELIYVNGIPPEANYTFKHALVRDAAYEALLKSRRKELHRLVAKTIEEQFPSLEATHPEVLARHWTEAGETEPAVRAWKEAGDKAVERFACREGEQYYRDALAVLATLPETIERDKKELVVQLVLGSVVTATRGFSATATAEVYVRARTLAEKVKVGDANSLDLFFAEHSTAHTRGEARRALVIADQMLEIAVGVATPRALALAHNAQGLPRQYLGDLAGARRHYLLSLEHYREEDFLDFRINPGVGSLSWAGLNEWMLGYADRASHYTTDAISLSRRQNNPFDLALALNVDVQVQSMLGNFKAALENDAEILRLSEASGFRLWGTLSRIHNAWVHALLEKSENAVELIREGLAELDAMQFYLARPRFLGYLAQAQAAAGNFSDALITLEQAARTNPDCVLYRPEMVRLRGEIRIKQQAETQVELELAAGDFRESIALAQTIGAKSWELRTTTSLARLLAQQGNHEEARVSLATIYDWFTEGFDTADLKDAKALLDELSA